LFCDLAGNYRPGLAGTYFLGQEFARPVEGLDVLRSLDQNWGRRRGNGWSGRWVGFIEGPYSGEVTFTAVVTNGIWLRIGQTVVIYGIYDEEERSGKVLMEKGKKLPIMLEFVSWEGRARLQLYWQWQGRKPTIVPSSALSYDPEKLPDTTKQIWKDTEAGWPANGGFWMWGDEMAVAFECGWFKDRPDWMDGHARDKDKENEDIVARSTDGGLTWTDKKYDVLSSDDNMQPSPGGIDFAHPDFAFKCQGERFYYSYDRAKTWHGPFRLRVPGLPGGDNDLESRTNYLVSGKYDCTMFLGVEPEGAEDLAYCARTTNGGKTFDFVSWISPEPDMAQKYERWAVYSGVRLSQDHLIAALRRKINKTQGAIQRLNWIDVFESWDDGKTWIFLSKVADTDIVNSEHNGNPPSILRLKDGRLCVTYGFRAEPFVMCAKLSSDNGETWGKPIILRCCARNWDFGYSRSLQRPDGKVVTVYYFATPHNRDQFIAATIWEPDKIK
jgi:hypothetical protein